jgi:nicotinamide-nucleotide amidase
MKAGILAIGTELLMGQIVNSNAAYLSRELNALGVGVFYHYTVGDNYERIESHLKTMLKQCDLIFTTGGLGPTLDDITKEVIAGALGLKMHLDQHSLERIEMRFREFNRPMTENNIRQAYFPENAIILDNDMGTAPACIIEAEEGKKAIIVLPGPPKEMTHIFERHIRKFIEKMNPGNIYSSFLSIYGMGESAVEATLMPLFDSQSNPTLATYASIGKVLLRVTSSGLAPEENKHTVEAMTEKIKALVGEYIVSESGEEIDVVVLNQLKERHMKIAFAESCTGGNLAARLIRNSGASEVVECGFVTYSNHAKQTLIHVSEASLSQYGAVSHEVCREMAEGTRKVSGADITVSVTGIAGPNGGSEEKPVGRVYIGIDYLDQVKTYEYTFVGDRETIQNRTVIEALRLVYETLENVKN